ncbi:MAG: NADH-quinone oxidoreductase subunit C [Chloroflexi bacterium]|nr:NADH-quinone oxidoreductase subunit C [Chloroflexota bacterium]
MTRDISQNAAQRIAQRFPGLAAEAAPAGIVVPAESLLEIAAFLKENPDLALDYLAAITAVDYLDHFEVVYHMTSITHNHSLMLKVRLPGRENLALPSLTSLWQGADLQEREVYDLMGIAFSGHPNMKRVLLWDGFQGHPLRKDFIYEPS